MFIFKKYSTSFFVVFVSFLCMSLTACFDGGGSGKGSGSGGVGAVVSASPAVTSSAPANGAIAVATNTKFVVVFNKAMKSETINESSFTLQGAAETAIVGTVVYNAGTMTATFSPNAALTASKLYTATITTAVQDESGKALPQNVELSFTTGTTEDNVGPTVSSHSPTDLATNVIRNTKVTVYFSEAIDPGTLTSASFELKKDVGDVVVAGSFRYINPTTVLFSSTNILEDTVDYTLTLTSAITDIAGNSLTPMSFGFTTGSEVSSSPAIVDLGSAENYVILGKTGISTTGTTHITGDIAVSPESLTAITGFSESLDPSGTFASSVRVNGKLFAANMSSPTPTQLTTAVSNMETAYTDAAGRVNPDFSELGAGEIGGLTLDPGLYKWGTGVLVTSDVTLYGSSTDVWIFQIGQDLKLQDGRAVVLSGGALAKNVFWQVAGTVTLQTGTTFNGIVLSQTDIVLKSSARLNGRAMAQTAVTLISNDVNEPQ